MVDDKNDQTPDPWAGIDAEGESLPADGFSFSFDSSGEAAAEPEAPAPIGEEIGSDAVGGDPVAGWLEPPADDATLETPLGVFPPDEPAVPEFGIVAEDQEADPFAGVEADGIHEEERLEQGAGESMIQSSAIQIGTGHSGIESASDVVSIDEWADPGADSVVGAPEATGESEPAFSDFGVVGEQAEAGEFPFESDSFDGASQGNEPNELGLEDAVGLAAAGAGLAVSESPVAQAPVKKSKAAKPAARQKAGGIGQMVGIVLGGLMSLPITYAILVWGFQKDPFKFTKMMPPEVAFLLPEKFQPGFKKPAVGPALDKGSPLDNLPAPPAGNPAAETAPVADAGEQPAEEAAGPPVSEPAPSPDADALATEKTEEPLPAATEEADLFEKPAVAAVPEPEPLDLSALEAAIAKASASFDDLESVDAADAARKKMLVGWYKNLALVAGEMVMLEKIAADTGRPLEKPPEKLEEMFDRIAGEEAVATDLAKLSGMWLASKKRPADGAILLATFDGTRQVGPYWSSLVRLDGAEPRTVAVISRREPAAFEGERVLVTGVVFDGDVLWAADCRRLEKKASKVEDLF
jgi:hypothetical protein